MNYNAVLPLTIESHNYSGFMSDLWGINMSPDHNGIDGKILQFSIGGMILTPLQNWMKSNLSDYIHFTNGNMYHLRCIDIIWANTDIVGN